MLGVWLSLHQWDFQLPNKPFVGLDNYKDLFQKDSVVYTELVGERPGDRDLHAAVRAAAGGRCRSAWRCC